MNKLIQWIRSYWKPPEIKVEEPTPVPVKQYKRRKGGRKPKFLPKCPGNGKRSYTMARAKKMAEKKSNSLLKLRGYKCEYCPHWHLTKKKNKLKMH